MKALYTEQNLTDIRKQISRRMLILLAILIVAVAAITLALISDNHKENRPELLTTLIVIFSGAAMIFCYDMLIHPLAAYRNHLETSLHGRSHEVNVVFDHMNEETSVVDGVSYRDLIFLGDADKHGDRERMFYWDQELPLPEFTKGQEVRIKYFDRFITGYQKI